jgi:hypothetical protein
VVNKETSVTLTVAEDLVDRDLEFFVPTEDHRDELGALYVPMLRIAIMQMDVVLQAERVNYANELKVSSDNSFVKARSSSCLTSFQCVRRNTCVEGS